MEKFVLPKLTKEEIENYRLWFEARDYLCYKNGKSCDPDKALELAKMSNHPDAKWLCSIFPDDVYNNSGHTVGDLANVFKAYFPDPKALCFYGMLRSPNEGYDEFVEAAELGYYYAQYRLSNKYPITNFSDINKHFEPEMIYRLAEYHKSISQVGDPDASWPLMRDCYKLSAQLGHRYAMSKYGFILNGDDPQRYYWLGKAAQNKFGTTEFIDIARDQLFKYDDAIFTKPNRKIIFQLGLVLKDHVELEGPYGEVFNIPDRNYDDMLQIVKYYKKYCQAAKDAVLCWMLIAKRLPIHKDLRKVIAMYVWEMSSDADYKIDN